MLRSDGALESRPSEPEDEAYAGASVGGPAPDDVMVVPGPQKPVRRRGQPMPAPAPYVPRPWPVAACYIIASTLIAMTQGLGLNLISANLYQIQGPLGATTNETVWLVAAYLAPNVSMTLMLTKVRAQYGLRRFAQVTIVAFVMVASMHLFVDDIRSAIAVRFFAGIAASPMSSLAFLYMLETFPPDKKLSIGMSLALTNISIAPWVARLISPGLLDIGDWNALFMLESALAMMSFCAIYLLPLNSPPKTPVIEPMDIVSYLFIAVGLGSIAVAATVGPFYWWFEQPWIGWLLAVGIASLTITVLIELGRENPLIDIRWISSKEILHFAGTLLLFRLLLSEQTSGAMGLLQVLGLKNEQMTTLFLVILGTGILTGLVCAVTIKPGRAPYFHIIALSLLIGGSLLDAQATSQTRPEQVYLSQAMITCAAVLFLPPAMSQGFMAAMAKGMNYILSFLIVFLTTQSLGGALGAGLFRTFVTVREKYHSSQIVENVVLTNPTVAGRIAQLGNAYRSVLGDTALRQAEGLALLGTQATREANVLAYNDAALVIAAAATLGLMALLAHVAFNRFRFILASRQTAAS